MFSYAVIMIIDHNHPAYREKWDALGTGKYNGAFYYSKEIVANIIPNVKTDRNWVTILVPNTCLDHSIVFIHNNLHPEYYDYLKDYRDLILVCGIKETAKTLEKRLGHKAIVLPLSVDVKYVSQFRKPITNGTAYVGRREKATGVAKDAYKLGGRPRQELLPLMARYANVYAVGRTAIEAKILGCRVLPYDPRFKDPNLWQILDNKEAAEILQEQLDKIDKCNRVKSTQKSDKD